MLSSSFTHSLYSMRCVKWDLQYVAKLQYSGSQRITNYK